MKSFFLFLALFIVNMEISLGCTELPSKVLSWTNNQFYSGSPFQIGGYDTLKTNLGLTDAELETIRLESLDFFKSQYGIPTETAVFNNDTKDTSVPGYGVASTVYFADCYRLDVTNIEGYQEKRNKITLAVAEFTFFTSSSANYGGKFAALYSHFGSVPVIQAGDGFSYGYYYLFEKTEGGEKSFLRRILFKGKFPTRSDTPFRAHEEQYLFDSQWGNGTGILELKFAPLPSGTLLTQLDSIWKFPAANEFYSLYGL